LRLKLDENLPASAARRLGALGFDVDTVVDEGLAGRADRDVWKAAQVAGRMLVTQDLDFSDVRTFAPGTHQGLVLVRVPDADQWRLGDCLVAWFSQPDATTWGGLLRRRHPDEGPCSKAASALMDCWRLAPSQVLCFAARGIVGTSP
jgi:predicted nuclease of predicted toxin-antitoxin system